jgi:hypothetical protein
MTAASEARFKEREAARLASIARVDPMHEAMRKVYMENPAFSEVKTAAANAKAAAAKQVRSQLPKLSAPPRPPASRLRLASVHLVDTAPFQALTYLNDAVYGGTPDDVGTLTVNGDTGDMCFQIAGGGESFNNASSVSCWCAIGQTYVMPPELAKAETGGTSMRFTASPSFYWSANWASNWWRLSSGDIWIGQVVNRFDQNWSFIDSLVSYQTSLISWNDYNAADVQNKSDSATAYNLSTTAFVQPNYFYNCWVWVGADVYGDNIDSGWSFANAQMQANVSSLIFDSL